MNLLSIATALFLLKGATSQECPNSIALEEWGETKFNEDSLTLYHTVVLASGPDEQSIFCARLLSDEESYIGFAISPSGTMNKALAIIGLPGSDGDSGTVQKYLLSSDRSATPLPDDQQTLMYTNISQEGGVTTLEFAKYLVEEGEPEISDSGENTFLWSQGKTNSLGYHNARGSFTLEYDVTAAPTSSTMAPSPAGSNGGTDLGYNEESTVSGRTLSPTGGYIPRDPVPVLASPAPSPSSPTDGTPTDGTPVPSKSETDAPPPPTPPTPQAGSGRRTGAKKMAGTVIWTGMVVAWFGV